MDGLSAAASVIAVLWLSSEVVKYINAAAGATKERRRLREAVRACGSVLQQLKDEAVTRKRVRRGQKQPSSSYELSSAYCPLLVNAPVLPLL